MLFIGDILDSNDDHSGTFRQFTLERVRVVEIFKGLPEGTREVWLDPGSGTSCYAHLSVGKRFFIDGFGIGRVSPDIAKRSFNYKGEPKPLPAGFDPRTALVVGAMGCSRTAEVRPDNEDIQFLRAFKAGIWKPRISGEIDQLNTLNALFQPHLPVNQASIRLSGPGGERTALTDQQGNFEFPNIEPGRYRISFQKSGFDAQEPAELTVPTGGCAWWQPQAKTNGRIRIRVKDKAGKPVPNLPITMSYESQGKLTDLYDDNSKTDATGVLDRTGLPRATYVVSVNPSGPTNPRTPYPATFYPGVTTSSAAKRIRLEPNEQRLDLNLTLPDAIPIRKVEVRVVNKDGRPQAGAHVFSKYSDVGSTGADGTVVLSVLAGFEDTIRAWKEFDTNDGARLKPWIDWKRWKAEVPLPGKTGDSKIEIRFEKWIRNGDK